MRLRELKTCDAKRMMKWMHDFSVVKYLRSDFASKTIDDCLEFISDNNTENSINLAIVSDDDCYMGTVSLKNITDTSAEFAITMCKDAMGKGYSIWAMKEMIKLGFEKYGLTEIYWCVSPENKRALRFYDKNMFMRANPCMLHIQDTYTQEQIDYYVWYRIAKSQQRNLFDG